MYKPFKFRGVFLCQSIDINNNLRKIMKGLTLSWDPSLQEEFVFSLIWLEEYGSGTVTDPEYCVALDVHLFQN